MNVFETIRAWQRKRILVIGDVGVDYYVWGKATRLCPEAPVPIFEPIEEEIRAGLAANVAMNLASLGADVSIIGVTGEDDDRMNLEAELVASKIGVTCLYSENSRKTTKKMRFMSGHNLVMRIDTETTDPIVEPRENLIASVVLATVTQYDAVILSDYAKGVLGYKLCRRILLECLAKGVKVLSDPKPVGSEKDQKYLNSTYMTPNVAEARKLVPGFVGPEEQLAKMIVRDYALTGGVLITLGSQGMLFHDGKSAVALPADAKRVIDVCGAGDTVAAVFLLAVLGGADSLTAMRFANRAAGIVVGKVGTSVITIDELKEG